MDLMNIPNGSLSITAARAFWMEKAPNHFGVSTTFPMGVLSCSI